MLRTSSGPLLFAQFILGIAEVLSEWEPCLVRYRDPTQKMLTTSASSAPQLLVKLQATDSNRHAEGALGNDNITAYVYRSALNTYIIV